MAFAIGVFFAGTKWYIRDDEKNKKGSIITKTFGCICTALLGRLRFRRENKEHWLDYADSMYPQELINDVKSFVKVLLVFVPVPVFWTL